MKINKNDVTHNPFSYINMFLGLGCHNCKGPFIRM